MPRISALSTASDTRATVLKLMETVNSQHDGVYELNSAEYAEICMIMCLYVSGSDSLTFTAARMSLITHADDAAKAVRKLIARQRRSVNDQSIYDAIEKHSDVLRRDILKLRVIGYAMAAYDDSSIA